MYVIGGDLNKQLLCQLEVYICTTDNLWMEHSGFQMDANCLCGGLTYDTPGFLVRTGGSISGK